MDLQNIKRIIEETRYLGGVKALAEAVGMTEQNLHRCVRENKIQAQDLEKVSTELKVSINEFFDQSRETIRSSGNYSPISKNGNVSVVSGDNLLTERIKSLEALVAEKNERISDLKDIINELKTRK